jgi:hypothetical protein
MMATFLFWMAQHSLVGQRSLEDPVKIVGSQLCALGHFAAWDPSNQHFLLSHLEPNSVKMNDVTLPAGPAYNVLIEGFTPAIVEIIADYHRQGARFLCLATEEPTAKGFNWGTQREMIARQEAFPLVAPYLDGILHLVPGQNVTDWYSRYAPSAYVELGYAPGLVRCETQREPPYDFGFYGSMTPRRLKILKKLAKRSSASKPPGAQTVRVVSDFASGAERDAAMQSSKVIVQLRKFDAMGLVSSSRCNTALCLGRPVVAEPHELSKPWDTVVDFAERKADFVNLAMATLADWRGAHARQFAAFRETFSPEFCVGNALRQIGVVNGAPNARLAA